MSSDIQTSMFVDDQINIENKMLIEENKKQAERIEALESYVRLQTKAYSDHFGIAGDELFSIVCREHREDNG